MRELSLLDTCSPLRWGAFRRHQLTQMARCPLSCMYHRVNLLTSLVQVLPGTDGETSTQGLDNLGSRCAEYYKQGELSLSPCYSCFKGEHGRARGWQLVPFKVCCYCSPGVGHGLLVGIGYSLQHLLYAPCRRSLCQVEGSYEGWQRLPLDDGSPRECPWPRSLCPDSTGMPALMACNSTCWELLMLIHRRMLKLTCSAVHLPAMCLCCGNYWQSAEAWLTP